MTIGERRVARVAIQRPVPTNEATRLRVVRWQEMKEAKYCYGQLSWIVEEELCLEAGF
jgi:hypothetical protein